MKKLLGLLFIGLLPLGAFAEDAKKEVPTFGDWAKQCEKDGDKEMCYIFQNVNSKDNGQMLMQVRIGFVPDNKEPIFIATVPLGALLMPGAALLVDEKIAPVKLPYLACGRQGCTTVGQPLKTDVVEAMQKGERAQVRVALMNQKILPLPISLKGFTRAYNSIAP